MKNVFILLALICAPLFVNAQAAPAFKWSETVHDFGKIKKGIPASTDFNFTNTGKTPLTLSEVKGSCGCTATKYTQEAVGSGKKGFVQATYNAANVGAFTKTVTVTSNVEGGQVILTIKGEVIE